MLNKILKIINGTLCPGCKGRKLFRLSDGRWKCSKYYFRYSAKRISDDLAILHCFHLGIPATKTAKDLKFSYNHRKENSYELKVKNYFGPDFN